MSCADLTKPGLLHEPSAAVISNCQRYRYWLHRRWLAGQGWTVFVMLNPSTADASLDDPTIRRCIRFAKDFGSHGLIVVNLFAWRATEPDDLFDVDDPVGVMNHSYIVHACELAAQHEDDGKGGMHVPGKVICAWGAHPAATQEQKATVMGWIEEGYGAPFCLGRTKDGEPKHPLYLPAAARPLPFDL
jgi:hypothetical protein